MKNFNELQNTHKMDNFLGKQNFKIWNQEENKNWTRTKPVKQNPKFKIYPQKPSSRPRHFKNKFYQTSGKQIILPFYNVLQRIKKKECSKHLQ